MAAVSVATLSKGDLFPEKLIPDLITKVKGHSALAKLSGQTPVAFNGNQQFVFNMPNEIDIVAENGAKSHGGVTLESVTIVPIKFEYGARVSDEFLYASEEEKIDVLTKFSDGFAKKVARGLDLAAFHGVNPRTGSASAVVGTNNFVSKVTQTVAYASATADENIDDAVAAVQGSDGVVTGMALAPAFGTALSKIKANGVPLYPEFRFGQTPNTFAGMGIDINRTVSDITYTAGSATVTNEAIIGDFANSFSWGYAKEIPMEIIPYGDPDNSGVDLKGYNQIYIRSEVYLGWAILDETAFARIIASESE